MKIKELFYEEKIDYGKILKKIKEYPVIFDKYKKLKVKGYDNEAAIRMIYKKYKKELDK